MFKIHNIMYQYFLVKLKTSWKHKKSMKNLKIKMQHLILTKNDLALVIFKSKTYCC